MKWTENEYNFQDIKNVTHTTVRMSCDTTNFPALLFCGPTFKPHGVQGLSNTYNLCLDPNCVIEKCTIQRIHFECLSFTNMLDKP